MTGIMKIGNALWSRPCCVIGHHLCPKKEAEARRNLPTGYSNFVWLSPDEIICKSSSFSSSSSSPSPCLSFYFVQIFFLFFFLLIIIIVSMFVVVTTHVWWFGFEWSYGTRRGGGGERERGAEKGNLNGVSVWVYFSFSLSLSFFLLPHSFSLSCQEYCFGGIDRIYGNNTGKCKEVVDRNTCSSEPWSLFMLHWMHHADGMAAFGIHISSFQFCSGSWGWIGKRARRFSLRSRSFVYFLS